MIVLSDDNFEDAVKSFDTLLVEFYAPVRVKMRVVSALPLEFPPLTDFRRFLMFACIVCCREWCSGAVTARSWPLSTRRLAQH